MTIADTIDSKTVIEDARARHAALVQVIQFIDRQATALMRLYVMIGIASASGAAAGLAAQSLIPRPAGFAFAGAVVISVVGAAMCMRANLMPSDISLPGRGPEFWQWALQHEASGRVVLDAYLSNLAERTERNRTLNVKVARALSWAKRFSLLYPPASLGAGLAAIYWSL